MNRRELMGMASVGVLAAGFVGWRVIESNAGSGTGAKGNFRMERSEAEWRAKLNPESFDVLRNGATEMPGSSPLLKESRKGIFACAGCDTPLFASTTKYDSKTGWPSFWEAMPDSIIKRPDFGLATPRTEVLCSTCGGHLGHVFTDGPKPTGLRYCMNGDALSFRPATA